MVILRDTFGNAISIIRRNGFGAFWKSLQKMIQNRRADLAALESQQPVPPIAVETVLRADESSSEKQEMLKTGSTVKILYVIHQFFPESYLGTQKFLLNLAITMQRRGHDVNVMTYSGQGNSSFNTTDEDFLSRKYVYKSIPVLAYKQRHPPLYGHWDIENTQQSEFALKVLERERPDLIHITHGIRVSSIAFAAHQLRIPYVVTLTDFFFLCPNCKLLTSQRSLCAGPERGQKCGISCAEYDNETVIHRLAQSEEILRGAEAVVAPSWFLGNLFKREFRWLEPRLIPYGIERKPVLQTKRHFDGTTPLVILYAGQLDVHKGVHVLIDAVTKMKSPNILVKIYGSGPPLIEWKLRKMANDEPRIRFCGVYTEDQLRDIFSSVDCAVIPSLWHENNTIVMREALASQVPCIVSDAGGMVDMIQEGKNGFVVRMGDSLSLANLLDRLVTQPDLLGGIQKAPSSFDVTTLDKEADDYEAVYRRALSAI
jgi:glycosyltransferase involved in cell wall biosynthesis